MRPDRAGEAQARSAVVEVARTSMAPGTWVQVPDVPGRLYAAIQLDPTWLGAAKRAAFQLGPVFLALEYAGGERAQFRLVPSTARNGLPLDDIPFYPEDVIAFFEGRTPRRPFRIALVGEGLESYRQPITVTWQQLDLRR